jgi:hypothetical protein
MTDEKRPDSDQDVEDLDIADEQADEVRGGSDGNGGLIANRGYASDGNGGLIANYSRCRAQCVSVAPGLLRGLRPARA